MSIPSLFLLVYFCLSPFCFVLFSIGFFECLHCTFVLDGYAKRISEGGGTSINNTVIFCRGTIKTRIQFSNPSPATQHTLLSSKKPLSIVIVIVIKFVSRCTYRYGKIRKLVFTVSKPLYKYTQKIVNAETDLPIIVFYNFSHTH